MSEKGLSGAPSLRESPEREALASAGEALYRRGYADGWRAALAVLDGMSPPQVPALRPPPAPGAKQAVLRAVCARPGLRGHEIVQLVALGERTVRTALHRLKRDGMIELRGMGWHLTSESNGKEDGSPPQNPTEAREQ